MPQRYQINLTGLCRGETGAGGILRIEDSAGHVKQNVLEEGFFDFLNKELESRPCLEADYEDFPFDFCGGYVGYLGYELKVECGVQSNSHKSSLPDAALFLADRAVVIDHVNDDIYVLALFQESLSTHLGTVKGQSGTGLSMEHESQMHCNGFHRGLQTQLESDKEAAELWTSMTIQRITALGQRGYAAGISRMKHKLPFLYGVDQRPALAACFGWQPAQVRFLHDSAAFLLGEIGAGAARNLPRAVGITLGTGIGSAFAIDGRVVTDGPGVPLDGEIWDLPYEDGIVEDYLSTRGIQGNYEERTGTLREVVEIASAVEHDADAAAVFADFGRHLGIALRMVVSVFAPQVVVLGGAISRSAHLFLPAAESHLEGLNLRLLPSALKDDAPLVGAGVEWFSAPS